MPAFATDHKTDPGYLDIAANGRGDEKALMAHRALRRTGAGRPHLVEIGPGGGAAVTALASALRGRGQRVDLTLVEVPGVSSDSLARAVEEFSDVGSCTLLRGHATDIGRLLDRPADVVSASALLHEVYSYGGGYAGIHALMRTLPTVLADGGFFAYRDVYAVDGPSLHEPVTHAYDAPSWLRFLRMFVPRYLHEGTHPYHHAQDELLARQDSAIVPIEDLDRATCAVLRAPVGLLREIQRHYITFRDHAWRSGALGFIPVLEGHLAADWLDARTGHKRVHYTLTAADRLPARSGRCCWRSANPTATTTWWTATSSTNAPTSRWPPSSPRPSEVTPSARRCGRAGSSARAGRPTPTSPWTS
ncbi:class I SAM-dependent methyltransferase [Nocardiopsis composta]